MNEELQSGNEELETMNEELLSQAGQIDRGERFLAAILDGLVVGVAVVTESLDVVGVEPRRRRHVRTSQRRSHLGARSALDIGLPVGEIGPLLHQAVSRRRSPRSTPVARRR